jgi:hypothetical protein
MFGRNYPPPSFIGNFFNRGRLRNKKARITREDHGENRRRQAGKMR